MKINWCKIIGHRWEPVFIKGTYNGGTRKFILCQCKRCGLGEEEVQQIGDLAVNRFYFTYSEKYFHE